MEFGKKKVGKVGTSKFLNILLPHKYVSRCSVPGSLPDLQFYSQEINVMGAGTPTPRASAS